MEQFSATLEILTGQQAGILTLIDSSNEWSGSGRIDLPFGSNSDLTELAYIYASRVASSKDGTLNRFRVLS